MFDVGYTGYVVLWAAIVVMIPAAAVYALVQTWKARERRDGKR